MDDVRSHRGANGNVSRVFTQDDAGRVLYGKDTTEGIVSIEPDGPRQVRIFRRDPGTGDISSHF